ncbi:MAG: hypothetical protein A2074_04455 [Candidatus Aquicultor primus]|uniref:GGDEF domain-containing protein n=1 Tax=Candidatus Aquicultor primus TaxID=1797195 RepID=A0A1F2UM82_9ACTN|nr:MAG: hypothetical protein A2074_04455 [Candidatus Aquicultor primus]
MLLKDEASASKTISLKHRLILLLTVMILPFVAFFFFKAADTRDRFEGEYQRSSLTLALEVARDVNEYINSTGDLLIPIANNNEVRTQNYPAVQEFLKGIWPNYKYYSNITFVDVNGDIQAAGRPPAPNANPDEAGKKVNVSDTPYYQRAMNSEGISIGDFMLGKLSGNPVVHITYPVFDYTGQRVGFVAAAFDLTRVQNRLLRANLPKHTVVAVLDASGIMLARNIEPAKWAGKNFYKEMGFKNMLGKPDGVGKVRSSDDTTRVFAFAALERVPWYVRVGVDNDFIEAQARKELVDHFVVFVPLLLVAIFGWIWIGRDVDRFHKKTERLGLLDPLTELWNYRKLNQDLDLEISRARRKKEKLSFAMIDIDNFKHYNDANGHQQGDEALKQVAYIISQATRDTDSVYRYGGEEMCVLFRDADKAGAMAVSERIRKDIEEALFAGEQEQPLGKLTISIGVATYPNDTVSKDGLIKCADVGLYRAKELGRNRLEDYSAQGFTAEDNDSHYLSNCS